MHYRTAIYMRLSKEDGDKEESNSIESQRRLLQDYMKQHTDLTFIKEYVDDGFTGTNFNRPNFMRLMKDIEAAEINCILVKDLSRFGRNYLESGRYIQKIFPERGVRFIAINDNVDTKDEWNSGFDMMLPIRNIFNESYSQDISRKVQSSFKAMQRAGAFCGAHTSYGYRKNPADKHRLIIDPYAASIVREIYEKYIAGYGQRAIATELNNRGILCPAEYKRQNGENYRNAKKLDSTTYWTYSTVHRILKNEMYKGAMVQNKTVRKMRGKAKIRPKDEWIIVEGTHEAIIKPDQWNRVQKLLKCRTRNLDFSQNTSVFAGFLKCADCGRAMTKRQLREAEKRRRVFYTCGSYSRSGNSICSMHYIRQEVLERIVLDDLNIMIGNIRDLKNLIEEQEQKCGKSMQIGKKELYNLEERLQKISRLKREAYMDYKEELLSKEEYLSIRSEYMQQEKHLNEKIQVLKDIQHEDSGEMMDIPWIRNLLKRQRIDELDRETIVQFIEEIIVYEKDADGQQKIKIAYRFSDELKDLFQVVYADEL